MRRWPELRQHSRRLIGCRRKPLFSHSRFAPLLGQHRNEADNVFSLTQWEPWRMACAFDLVGNVVDGARLKPSLCRSLEYSLAASRRARRCRCVVCLSGTLAARSRMAVHITARWRAATTATGNAAISFAQTSQTSICSYRSTDLRQPDAPGHLYYSTNATWILAFSFTPDSTVGFASHCRH